MNKQPLTTERLILRAWEEKDIDDLVEGLNNLEVSKWMGLVPYPYTLKIAADWIASCQKLSHDEQNYEWAIVLKSENKVIGGTGLSDIDAAQGTAGRGGIWLNSNYHGYGYGTEAFNCRLDFAFNTLGLRRVSNGFLVGNQCSQKMQEKLGYKIEGLKRQAYLCVADGQIKDEVMTGLLREEWRGLA
jgi:ribosomal-protein-alanine N-acetyltransferase